MLEERILSGAVMRSASIDGALNPKRLGIAKYGHQVAQ